MSSTEKGWEMFVEAPYLLSGTSTPELLRAFVMLMVPRGSKKVHSEFLPNLKSRKTNAPRIRWDMFFYSADGSISSDCFKTQVIWNVHHYSFSHKAADTSANYSECLIWFSESWQDSFAKEEISTDRLVYETSDKFKLKRDCENLIFKWLNSTMKITYIFIP